MPLSSISGDRQAGVPAKLSGGVGVGLPGLARGDNEGSEGEEAGCDGDKGGE